MAVTINRETNITLPRGGDPITIVVGADGAPGMGIPAGGIAGQVIAKASTTDFDVEWVDPAAGGGGGGLSRTGNWNYDTQIGSVPGNREFTADSATPAAITWFRFDDVDNNNADHTEFMAQLLSDKSKLLMQVRLDSTIWALFQVTGTPTDAGGYVEVPVTLQDQSGTWPPANNASTLVDMIINPGGTSDHGSLQGLNDDDHTQYGLVITSTQEPENPRVGTVWVNPYSPEDPYPDYMRPVDLVGGTEIDVDSSSQPGKAIINSTYRPEIREAPMDDLPYGRESGNWTRVEAFGSVSAHEAEPDPHNQYLTQARGDDRYYTESETDSLLAGKSDTAHTHTESQITDLGVYPDATDGVAGQIPQTDGSTWTFINTPSGGGGDSRIYVGLDQPDPALYDLWYQPDYDQLEVTTTGATFTPRIWLSDGSTATITWIDDLGNILGTGTTPNINFGSAATRTVRMDVDRPEDVEVINLGYDNEDDAGPVQIGSAYNWPPGGLDNTQIYVTGVSNVNAYPNLIAFMAASRDAADGNRLVGHLDLSGLSNLTHVECFYAKVQTVDLTGCSSLIRVCFEQNRLATLDVNPCRATLIDLRGARQEGLTMVPLGGDGTLPNLYHYCVQGQAVTNRFRANQLPAVEEYWVWNSNISGEWLVPQLPGLHYVYNNQISTLTFLDDASGGVASGFLRIRDNAIRTINNMENGARFDHYQFIGNGMPPQLVDYVIQTIEAYGTSNGQLDLDGQPRTSASNAAYDALIARGWAVTVPSPDITPPGPVTGLSATPGSSSISLSWTNPGDGDFDSIVVRYAPGATPPATVNDGTDHPVSGTPQSTIVTGLANDTQYSVSVFALDTSLNASTPATATVTTTAPDVTPPGPVTGLGAVPSGNSITLNWTNPVDGDLTFIIVRRALGATPPATVNDGTGVAVSGTPQTVTDTGLTESTQYSYSVWARDDSLNDSTPATVTASTTAGETLLWQDTFDRPDADGVTGVGNNWTSTNGESGINIRSNQLDRAADTTYNQELREDGAAVSSQIDMACEIDIEDAYVTSYIAVLMRCSTQNRGASQWVNGVRFFCGNPATSYDQLQIGNALNYNTENRPLTQINPVPASWGSNGVNTLRGELRGTEARMILNGVHVATASVASLTNQPYDLGDSDVTFGIGGDTRNNGGARINAIRVYAL